MKPNSYLCILGCAALLLSGGCAQRYQDLLRDRDLEIRELSGQISDLRSESDEARRQAAGNIRAEPRDAGFGSGDAELARIQGDLPDLDVRRKSGRLSIGIENTVTFDSGSVHLKSTAGTVLRQIAAVLKRDFSGRRIYVEGHTDTDPIRKTKNRYRSNLHLSAERAEAVASYLVSQCNLPARDVAVVGYGQHEPRVPGSSDSAKSRNRRVEIVVGDTL